MSEKVDEKKLMKEATKTICGRVLHIRICNAQRFFIWNEDLMNFHRKRESKKNNQNPR